MFIKFTTPSGTDFYVIKERIILISSREEDEQTVVFLRLSDKMDYPINESIEDALIKLA